MESPHVAGLFAYFLSIYPSKEFDPVFDDADNLVSIVSQRVLSSHSSKSTCPSSLYAMAHHVFPPFIASYLPRSEFIDLVLQHTQDNVAPVPKARASYSDSVEARRPRFVFQRCPSRFA
jgi:cerevisin